MLNNPKIQVIVEVIKKQNPKSKKLIPLYMKNQEKWLE